MAKIKFNKQQLEVINHKEGACCVIAGAGAGKSTVLIERVRQLIESGVNPYEIMMVTYTNNSAADLRKKIKKANLEGVQVGTFHAICKRILETEGVSTSKQLIPYEIDNIFKTLVKKPKTKEIMSYISYHKVSGIGINDDFLFEPESYTEDEMRDFYKAYEDIKSKKRAMDFTDWMVKTISILKKKKDVYSVKYLLVDEQQDNDVLQNKLMELLCPSKNIMVVGDFRQSIYGFKGGSPELFMNFYKKYPGSKVLNLDMNYRSTKNIVEKANDFIAPYFSSFKYYSDSIANNQKEGYIKLISNMDKETEGKKISELIQKDIQKGTRPSDIAVLYRNNDQSFYVENELKEKGVDYHIETNNNFFERKEIKAIICMLRLLQNPSDNSAYDTIFRTRCEPFTFIPNTVLSDIEDLAAMRDISLLDASEFVKININDFRRRNKTRENLDKFIDIHKSLLVQYQKNTNLLTIINNIIKLFRIEEFMNDKYDSEELEERLESLVALRSFIRNNTLDSFLKFIYSSQTTKKAVKNNEVQMMTIHKSKGLEFKKVYLVGVQDGKLPSRKARDECEEARLFYVAVTRAKEDLVVSEIGFGSQFTEEYFNIK